MRIFADANIVAPGVRALRDDGHDVVYAAERPADPGDAALLAEACGDGRVFVTKDHDLGVLVFRDGALHAGILLIDDLGGVAAETALLRGALADFADDLAGGAFVRATLNGVRVVHLTA